MPIHFFYARRESLTAKSEAYKKAVRKYLESLGFSQTTDSFVEGTFEDQTFYNPTIQPGRRFLVEDKAEELSLTKPEFADQLVKWFRRWRDPVNGGFIFYLFATGVKKAEKWQDMFSETSGGEIIKK